MLLRGAHEMAPRADPGQHRAPTLRPRVLGEEAPPPGLRRSTEEGFLGMLLRLGAGDPWTLVSTHRLVCIFPGADDMLCVLNTWGWSRGEQQKAEPVEVQSGEAEERLAGENHAWRPACWPHSLPPSSPRSLRWPQRDSWTGPRGSAGRQEMWAGTRALWALVQALPEALTPGACPLPA